MMSYKTKGKATSYNKKKVAKVSAHVQLLNKTIISYGQQQCLLTAVILSYRLFTSV